MRFLRATAQRLENLARESPEPSASDMLAIARDIDKEAADLEMIVINSPRSPQ
jgi:hypothetical protein